MLKTAALIFVFQCKLLLSVCIVILFSSIIISTHWLLVVHSGVPPWFNLLTAMADWALKNNYLSAKEFGECGLKIKIVLFVLRWTVQLTQCQKLNWTFAFCFISGTGNCDWRWAYFFHYLKDWFPRWCQSEQVSSHLVNKRPDPVSAHYVLWKDNYKIIFFKGNLYIWRFITFYCSRIKKSSQIIIIIYLMICDVYFCHLVYVAHLNNLQYATSNEIYWWSIWVRVQELCASWGGRPGLPILMRLMVSVDVKQHWTMLTHWSQFVPNMSTWQVTSKDIKLYIIIITIWVFHYH